jgi:hypothetical protein
VFALNAAGVLTALLTDKFAAQRDFLTYWCSARQLVIHANPYDAAAVGALERSVGYSASLPTLVMRNAPYSLPFVYPLGLLSLRAASLLWSLWMVLAAWFSVRLVAASYGRTSSKINLLAFAFAPLLSCFIAGQTAVFVLLGVALFLRFHQSRPLVAGASLWLCALKPQNFVLFGVVLIAWCVAGRRWRILLAAAVTMSAIAITVTAMRPEVWHEYWHMMSAAQIENQFIPCLSTMVRVLIRPTSTWLQWVPMIAGCSWAAAYFLRQSTWQWSEQGRLLLVVSVVVAPYSWFMDQTIFLAALLPALYRNTSDRATIATFALLSAGIETANLFGVPLSNAVLYPWTACMWLGWYLWANQRDKADREHSLAAAAVEVTSVS